MNFKNSTPELQEKIVRLEALRERVRTATGPDREIDAHLAEKVGGLPMTFCNFDAGCYHGECNSPGCGKPLGMHDERKSYPINWEEDDRLPRYTASIDAALGLVERLFPGAEYEISTIYHIARVNLPLNAKHCSFGEDESLSVPLAILDALLTALIEQERG